MQKSGEDYLEAVLQISKEMDTAGVRITDIANKLGVSKPSVIRAMQILKDDGYVEKEAYGDIFLTSKGKVKAGQVLYRHGTLTEFFTDVLGVSPEQAEKDACLIEHDISAESMEKLVSFMKAYKKD